MRSRLAALLVAALAVSGLSLVATPSASAAVPAPTNLTADFGSDPNHIPRNPTLRWTPASGATGYRVQIATDSSFSSTVYDQQTVGHQVTPNMSLPIGTLYWRVAGLAGTTSGPFASAQSFTESWNTKPQLTAPANTSALTYPDNPAVFSWTALDGATSYTLQIDDADNFIGADSYTTTNTSYTLTEPQTVNQTYYWRVQATSSANGVVSPWSDTFSYSYGWPSTPHLVSPTDGGTVTDVAFSWGAVPGAKNYELQVSPNGDWTNNNTIDATLTSTTYTPGAPLPNGSYFWRVRSIDAAGHFGPWSDPLSFTRQWSDRPVLQTPFYDSSAPNVIPQVHSDVEFSWSPVSHAGYYEVQFAVDQNFSQTVSCYTNHTEWTPYTRILPSASQNVGEPGGCLTSNANVPIWSAGTTYYWRVRGIDDPSGFTDPLVKTPSTVVGIWSAPGEFIRNPDVPVPTAPDNNSTTVDVPTMAWSAVAGAEKYRVTLKNKNGTAVSGFPATTYATSITPTLAGLLTSTLSPYSWTVQAVDATGFGSMITPTQHFSIQASPSTTTDPALSLYTPADGAESRKMPSFSWAPMAGASNYVVHVMVNGFEITPLVSKDPYPAFAPMTVPATAGTYTWWVEAQDSGGATLGNSAESTYRVLPLDALTKTDYLTPTRCDVQASCTTINDTPTFSWNPIPDAALYRVTIANDRNFTNIVREYTTAYTTLTPRESLLDSQAGQAYYWFVRPCFDAGMTNCGSGSDDPSVNGNASAFRKRSTPVVLTAPTSQSSVADQITLKWQDYLTSENGSGASQEAALYHVQVSTAADFASPGIIDDKYVDATSYTLPASTYPEGPLYWRVQAMDATGNPLTWSDNDGHTTYGWLVTKQSAAPHQTYPAAGANETGVPYMAWTPQNFAASYTVEVYKNADLNASPNNLVATAPTKFAAWAPKTGLPQGDYVWRVRRTDGSNKVGPWSSMRAFHLEQAAPTLTSPAPNALINSSDVVFSWTPIAGASQYRWQMSSTAGFNNPTQQITVNSSWSPVTVINDGTYYWRVQVLDGNNNVLATSAARSFTKDGTAPTVRTYGPSAALPINGSLTATFSEPVKNVNAASFQVTVAGTSGAVPGTVQLTSPGGVPTATWTPTKPLMPGQTYTATLTSGITDDPAGNPLASKSWNVRTETTVDNTSAAMVEQWDRDAASAALGGTYDSSNMKGSSATYHFTGSSISVLGARMKSGGYAAVYLDGVKQTSTASFFNATTQYRKAIWSKSGLASGAHTVQVTVLGTKPKGATGSWVYLDGFQVGTSQVDQTNAAVHEAFARVNSAGASGGSYDNASHATSGDNNARPSYSVTFRGTSISVYAQRSPSAGKAAVYLDGKLKSTVDLRSTSSYITTLVGLSGLSNAVHTVRIDVVGTKTGAGSAVGIDYLRLT